MNKFLITLWMILSFTIIIKEGYSQTNAKRLNNDTYSEDNDADLPHLPRT